MSKEKILAHRTPEGKVLDFKPKLVLFDLCSTILDTMKSDKETLNNVLGDYGLGHVKDINAIKTPGKTLYNSANDIASDHPTTFRVNYMIALIFNLGGKAKPFPGAGDTLSILKAAKIKTGYISNRNVVYEDALRLSYPLLHDAFDVRQHPKQEKIGFGDHIVEKPVPGILDAALLKLNNKTGSKFKAGDKKILFIGDAKSDIELAEACGITPVLFYSEESNITPEFIRARPGLKIVKDHSELQDLLLSQYSKREKMLLRAKAWLSFNKTYHPRPVGERWNPFAFLSRDKSL